MYFPVPDEGRLDASLSGADLNDPGHRPMPSATWPQPLSLRRWQESITS
jgi:hypothetical protein